MPVRKLRASDADLTQLLARHKRQIEQLTMNYERLARQFYDWTQAWDNREADRYERLRGIESWIKEQQDKAKTPKAE